MRISSAFFLAIFANRKVFFMLIDSHIHVFPDALAPKVIPKLAAISGYDNQTDGTLSSTLEKMREWGVDKGVFLSIATKPSQQKSINDFCASIASDTVIPFGSVHPDGARLGIGDGADCRFGVKGHQTAP